MLQKIMDDYESKQKLLYKDLIKSLTENKIEKEDGIPKMITSIIDMAAQLLAFNLLEVENKDEMIKSFGSMLKAGIYNYLPFALRAEERAMKIKDTLQ